jgi:hypothetical protein
VLPEDFGIRIQHPIPFLGDTLTREHPPAELFIAFAFLAPAALSLLLTHGRHKAETANPRALFSRGKGKAGAPVGINR